MTQLHLIIQAKFFLKKEIYISAKGVWIIYRLPFFQETSKNPENAEASPKLNSALQALALSDIEEGMGHNVTRAQGLQEELPQRRASLLQNSTEAQALKGQEELLADIVEDEMAHQMQVSVLLHLYLR